MKPSYTISENGQDAGVSVLTGRASAQRATLSTSKAYHLQRDYTFEPKVFAELKNAPYKRWVELGEGTHMVMLEKNRMQFIHEVEMFLEESPQALN